MGRTLPLLCPYPRKQKKYLSLRNGTQRLFFDGYRASKRGRSFVLVDRTSPELEFKAVDVDTAKLKFVVADESCQHRTGTATTVR
jgi:hypothetical protein